MLENIVIIDGSAFSVKLFGAWLLDFATLHHCRQCRHLLNTTFAVV